MSRENSGKWVDSRELKYMLMAGVIHPAVVGTAFLGLIRGILTGELRTNPFAVAAMACLVLYFLMDYMTTVQTFARQPKKYSCAFFAIDCALLVLFFLSFVGVQKEVHWPHWLFFLLLGGQEACLIAWDNLYERRRESKQLGPPLERRIIPVVMWFGMALSIIMAGILGLQGLGWTERPGAAVTTMFESALLAVLFVRIVWLGFWIPHRARR